MDIKLSRGTQHSAVSRTTKLGFCSHSVDEIDDEYKIYIIDVDTCSGSSGGVGDYTHINPTILFKGRGHAWAFCVLDSTLYVFEGYTPAIEPLELWGRSAAKYELSPDILSTSGTRLEDNKLCKLRPMHYIKCHPRAILTPDRKMILVFSAVLFPDDTHTQFELYDISNDSWEKLPGISYSQSTTSTLYDRKSSSFLPSSKYPRVDIEAYSFIDESRFVIQMGLGLAVLDLQMDVKEWKWRDLYDVYDYRRVPWRGGYFVTVKDEFVFTPRGIIAFDRRGGFIGDGFIAGEVSRECRLPISSFPPTTAPKFYVITPSIAFLEHNIELEVCNFCVLQAEPADETITETVDGTVARLLIDVCQIDLGKLETRIITSLKFVIDHHPCLFSLDLFSI